MKDIGGAEAGQPNYAGMRCAEGGRLERADGRATSPTSSSPPAWSSSAAPTRRSSGCCRPPSPRRTARRATRGTRSTAPAARAAARRRRSRPASCRSRTPATAAARSACPASMCGLVGLKPTRGRCSFGPAIGERWSGFSDEFAMTRSVRDTAALLDVTGGPMPGDPYTAAPPARPFPPRRALPPARCASASCARRRATRHRAARPSASPPSTAPRARSPISATRSRKRIPTALDDADCVMHYVDVVAGQHRARARGRWAERIGRALGAGDVEAAHLGARRARPRRARPPSCSPASSTCTRFGRRMAAWWAGGFDLLLTPTQAAPPPRDRLRSARPPRSRCAPSCAAAPYGVFTSAVQSLRPARDLAAAALDRGRTAGRRAAGRGVRARGLLLPVAAQLEEGGSLARSPAAAARLVGTRKGPHRGGETRRGGGERVGEARSRTGRAMKRSSEPSPRLHSAMGPVALYDSDARESSPRRPDAEGGGRNGAGEAARARGVRRRDRASLLRVCRSPR